nr:MAG TPA: hypothetical protein [Caudoviricetes sp.]DAT07301.1 MAG TPA: hypothetical protein [Caudoviricetes sp.]
MKENNNIGLNVGFLDLLTLTFIVLKLCNVIDWGWWWVLSPILIQAAILIILFTILRLLVKK